MVNTIIYSGHRERVFSGKRTLHQSVQNHYVPSGRAPWTAAWSCKSMFQKVSYFIRHSFTLCRMAEVSQSDARGATQLPKMTEDQKKNIRAHINGARNTLLQQLADISGSLFIQYWSLSIQYFLSFYLSDRSFSVRANQYSSTSASPSCGVSQGLILGPL